MIAAIYARKSTDQGAVSDEARSVTRQVEHAQVRDLEGLDRRRCAHHVDVGISGAEFAARPGFVRLRTP
jgi:DNA invertase Pin-like site-specific DNA recombinase